MGLFVGLIIATLLYSYYKRSIPPCGLERIDIEKVNNHNFIVLDVRDFIHANKFSFAGATNIPLAYLKRYYKGLKGSKICIVAAEQTDVNLSARFLKSKGYHVVGYYLLSDQKDSSILIELNSH